jgi:tRNA A37 threonylcarbamoyladenosine dehydratase
VSDDFDLRFGGIARLYGTAALARFRKSRVAVIGIGGVGSRPDGVEVKGRHGWLHRV